MAVSKFVLYFTTLLFSVALLFGSALCVLSKERTVVSYGYGTIEQADYYAGNVVFITNPPGKAAEIRYVRLSDGAMTGTNDYTTGALRNAWIESTSNTIYSNRIVAFCTRKGAWTMPTNQMDDRDYRVKRYTASRDETIQSCAVDWSGRFFYLNTDQKLIKLIISPSNLYNEYSAASSPNNFGTVGYDSSASVDPVSGSIFFGTYSSGKILKVDSNGVTSIISVGFGYYTTIVYANNKYYLANTGGIGLVVDPTTLNIERLFFTVDGYFTSAVVSEGASFWGTNSPGEIIRYNSNFDAVDNITMNQNKIAGMFLDKANLKLTTVGGSSIDVYNIASCNGYSSCSSCIGADADFCGWCHSSGTCAASGQSTCGAGFLETSLNSCPVLTGLTPPSGAVTGNTAITLTGNKFVKGLTYQCVFNNGNKVPGTWASTTSVTCSSPPVDKSQIVPVSVIANNIQYTSNSRNYEYYTCEDFGNCSTCFGVNRPECVWCLGSLKCSASNNCPAGVVSATSSCPTFDITPTIAPLTLGTVSVYATGNNFISNTNYQMKFVGPQTRTYPAKWVNTSAIYADANLNEFSVGDYSVSISIRTTSYSQTTRNFKTYDCRLESTCSGCLSSGHDCQWCSSTQSCSTNGGCASTSDVSSFCPQISAVNPPSSLVTGNKTVNVTFNVVLPPGTYSCSFGTVTVPSVSTTTRDVMCVAPASVGNAEGTVALQVLRNGKAFTEQSWPFVYFDCTSKFTCGECLDPVLAGACQWCLGATDNKACHLGSSPACGNSTATQCPAIEFLEPADFRIRNLPVGSSPFNLTVVSNYYLQGGSTYQCRISALNSTDIFGVGVSSRDVPAILVNGTVITCPFPAVTLDSSVTYVKFQVEVVRNGYLYTSLATPFEMYDCLIDWNNCDSCSIQPLCGWCVTNVTSECLPQHLCDSLYWQKSACPRVESVQPNYGLLEGGTVVNITGTEFIPMTGLQCKFGLNSLVNATFINNTTMICVAPDVTSIIYPNNTQNPDTTITDTTTFATTSSSTDVTPAGTSSSIIRGHSAVNNNPNGGIVDINDDGDNPKIMEFQLIFKDKDYSVDTLPFQFIECSQFTSCTSCEANAELLCGWCLPEGRCLPSYSCNDNVNTFQTWRREGCPRVDSVSPAIGDLKGGTPVTISGSLFINHPDLIVMFGDKPAEKLEYIDDQSVVVTAPATNTEKEIELQFLFKGSEYTTNVVKWNYVRKADDKSNSTPLIAALVSVGGVGILGGLAGFFLYKRRQAKKRINLVVPKYDQIAFASFMNPQYDRKAVSEKIHLLEDLLLAPEKTLVIATSNITQSTESDNLAKCLVYVYEDHNQTLDLILTYIDLEVSTSKQDTIFRQNSVVTKMFKFYSRMVCTEYLFNTLARYIAELDWAASKGEKSENALIESSIEMEVDPSKMTDEEDSNVNKLQLMLVAQKIFNAIMKSKNNIPKPVVTICSHVRRTVKEAFPGFEYKAMSAFFFLRLVCPSLAAPQAYGLLPNAPSPAAQRQLVLLSKVLQMLANGQRFGKKEEFMVKMNDFIEDNEPNLQNFYESFPSHLDVATSPYDVPKVVKENSLVWIQHHLSANASKVESALENGADFSDGVETKNKLQSILQELGPLPEKTGKIAKD